MSRLNWPGASTLPQLPFRRLFRPIRREAPAGAHIVTAYTDGQVTLRSNRAKIGYHEAADTSTYNGVRRGDFVVHGLDIMRGSVGVSDSDGVISPVCIVCEPIGPIEPRFAAYAMRLQAASDFPRALARGVREGGADFRRWETLAELPLPVPSLQVQHAVVGYLDRETAQIDAFIAKNKELIALLTDHRSTVIDRLLSDSMQQAEVVKLNWELSFLNGDRGSTYPSRDEFVESGIPFINAGHLVDGSLSYDHMNYVSPEKFAEMGGAKLKEDDLLFCLRGSVGKLGLFSGRETGALASSLVAMRPRTGRISMPYLAAVLESKRAQDLIDLAQTGSAQPNLSVEQLSQFRFPMPNANKQLETANRIAEIRQRSTSSFATAHRAIELAKERRAALISAAVTGKIDVGKEASAA